MPNSIEQLLNDPVPEKSGKMPKIINKNTATVKSTEITTKVKTDTEQSGITAKVRLFFICWITLPADLDLKQNERREQEKEKERM